MRDWKKLWLWHNLGLFKFLFRLVSNNMISFVVPCCLIMLLMSLLDGSNPLAVALSMFVQLTMINVGVAVIMFMILSTYFIAKMYVDMYKDPEKISLSADNTFVKLWLNRKVKQ